MIDAATITDDQILAALPSALTPAQRRRRSQLLSRRKKAQSAHVARTEARENHAPPVALAITDLERKIARAYVGTWPSITPLGYEVLEEGEDGHSIRVEAGISLERGRRKGKGQRVIDSHQRDATGKRWKDLYREEEPAEEWGGYREWREALRNGEAAAG